MRVIWFALAFFAVQATVLGWAAIFGDPAWLDPVFQGKYTRHLTLVRCHGGSAGLALLLGLIVFLPVTRRLGIHRHLGRIYLAAVSIAAATALPMSAMAEGGWSSRLSFFLLSVLWVTTGFQAYQNARNGNFPRHRRWMIRNYSLTYSAVLSRLLLNLLVELGLPFEQVYPATTWSWLCGLAVGEWWTMYSKERSP